MSFSAAFVARAREALEKLDCEAAERLVEELCSVREREGRLFVLGVGGSAANASHAVNDFRKLCGIEAYAPTDNVAELTARTNDEGWESTFAAWLRTSRLGPNDLILVLSVGGGDRERNVSPNLVAAMEYAQSCGAPVIAIVGRDGGTAGRSARSSVIVPTVDASLVTPITEALQGVVLHLLVSHPRLRVTNTTW
ncbi:MAG TPA: SIS domain-containing protein [Polyangiaceae bacterium]|nr:SIS domain-containing protein [Polyangiaceae bacterium]